MACWQCTPAGRDDVDPPAEAGAGEVAPAPAGEVAPAPADVLCPQCGALQPPARDADHFSRLGFPRRYAIDPDDVVARHRAQQRKVHPDRYASRSPRERAWSLEHAT